MTTLDTIEALETLPVKIDYVGETIRDENWQCDQWRVTLSSKAGFHSFDYFTGLGRRTKAAPMHNPPRINTIAWVNWQKTRKPSKPKIADVLHSLVLDAIAADENFHDWCANFGYSDDSVKAMNTYKACIEVAVALRKHFSPDTLRTVRELLQDY
jgi:hypothetical protein